MALAGQPCRSVPRGEHDEQLPAAAQEQCCYISTTFAKHNRSLNAEILACEILHHFEGLRPANFRVGATLTGEIIFHRRDSSRAVAPTLVQIFIDQWQKSVPPWN